MDDGDILPKNAKMAFAKSEAVENPLTTEEHSTANAKLTDEHGKWWISSIELDQVKCPKIL